MRETLGRDHCARDRRYRDQAQAREATRDRPKEKNTEITLHKLMPSETGDELAEDKHGAQITGKEIADKKYVRKKTQKRNRAEINRNHKIAELMES